MTQSQILQSLAVGDLRTVVKSDKLVAHLSTSNTGFDYTVSLIGSEDKFIRMHAADIVEKVASKNPKLLQKHKKKLLSFSSIEQQEVKWHLAQLYSYFENLSPSEQAEVEHKLFSWLHTDKSNIVRVFALQTLAEFALKDPNLKKKILTELAELEQNGSPSLKSRARKLLKMLTS